MFGIIGPYFIDEVDPGNPTTKLNASRYQQLLRDHVLRDIKRKLYPGEALTDYWWQQDGASPHTAETSLSFLRGQFVHIFAKGGDIEWPALSPDLNPLDYWFWADLKRRLRDFPTRTIDEVKDSIENVITQIQFDQLHVNPLRHFSHRLKLMLDQNGGHSEHLKKKKRNRTPCNSCNVLHFCDCHDCDRLCSYIVSTKQTETNYDSLCQDLHEMEDVIETDLPDVEYNCAREVDESEDSDWDGQDENAMHVDSLNPNWSSTAWWINS